MTLPRNPPDRSPTYLKLTKGALDILKGVVEFFPIGAHIPNLLRVVARTGNALGAVADGLGLISSPSPPAPYRQVASDVAKLQQRERDITQAQRRYILADWGLLSTIGAEVKGRLLTLDETAALSSGRQAFAIWVTQLYLPAFWRRYQVTRCGVAGGGFLTYLCRVPDGSFVRVTGRHGIFTDFNAVLQGNSRCTNSFYPDGSTRSCEWHTAPKTWSRIVDPIPSTCRYDPTPGSIAAWRYGCPYGMRPAELIDGTNGWNFPLSHCAADEGRCTNVSRVRGARGARIRNSANPPRAS